MTTQQTKRDSMATTPRPLLRSGLAFALMLAPFAAAQAYVGPGAGLSLLGALWGVVAAIGAALLFVVLWPIRRMMRRRKTAANPSQPETQTHASADQTDEADSADKDANHS